MDRKQVLEKIRKLEALAKSTTSRAESQAAFKAASRLRTKYRKLLGPKFVQRKYTQEEQPCKEYFCERFCVYCISMSRCDEIVNDIYTVNALKLDGENKIDWQMEKFVTRNGFLKSIYVDLHISFTSTSLYSLQRMVSHFLQKSGLSLKDGGGQANRE